MQLNSLLKLTERSKKRLGRGIGSGRGKTSGRGTKGQKARDTIKPDGVGGGLALYKKLPYRRGFTRRGGNPKRSLKPILIKTDQLNSLAANSVVNLELLIEKGLVSEKIAKKRGVKVLVSDDLKVKLEINLPVSKNVSKIIEKAGGKVV